MNFLESGPKVLVNFLKSGLKISARFHRIFWEVFRNDVEGVLEALLSFLEGV